MTPKLKSTTCVPYGGMFVLDIPERGFVGKGTSFNHIAGKIKEYRRANAIPVGLGFTQELERELCLKYPEECENLDPRIPMSHHRITLNDVLEGTKMMVRFKLSGNPLVSQAEAERRAAICAQCDFNSDFIKPCGGICQTLKDAVHAIVGNRQTKYDKRLRSCRICHCFNSAAVHVDLTVQTEGLTEEKKRQFRLARELFGCWKNQ